MTFTPPPDTTPIAEVFSIIRDLAAEVSGGGDYRAGREISVPSGSGGVNVNVTFSTPMPTTPAVQITVNHPNLEGARVTNQDVNGFTARFDRSGSGSYWFNYYAVLEK